MTQSDQKAPPYYPKTTCWPPAVLQRSSVWHYWCSPRGEVEAKRTTLNLELESNTDRLLQEKDDLLPQSVTNSSDEGTPFAQVEGASDDNTAEQDSDKPGTSGRCRHQARRSRVEDHHRRQWRYAVDRIHQGRPFHLGHARHADQQQGCQALPHLKVGRRSSSSSTPKESCGRCESSRANSRPSAWTRPTGATPSNAEGPDRPAYRLCPWPYHQLAVRCRS